MITLQMGSALKERDPSKPQVQVTLTTRVLRAGSVSIKRDDGDPPPRNPPPGAISKVEIEVTAKAATRNVGDKKGGKSPYRPKKGP
jgi:hypothetical protein